MYSSPAASRPATPHGMSTSADRSNTSQGTQERLMQVKVLYTFDDNNTTNCLARCPQPFKIRTAFLEPSSEIGIIELRTCIQSIITASPELIAKLGQDYTVYAYDYSEYATPLVGQGMLSWVLASSSTTPMAPANQSRTMVTGRVCKNLLGLFSDGVKETLEVKLRLVPVPTCLQSEYLASMEKYRDASAMASEVFDVDAWTTFLRANPTFGTGTQAAEAVSPPIMQMDLMDSRMPTASNTNQRGISASSSYGSHPLQNTAMPSSDVSEMEVQKCGTANRQEKPSRPSSRASNRGRHAPRPKAASRVNSFQNPEPASAEEGPSRKRARTTKADFQGPSPFASNAESLRVTASTAASIRGHRLSTSHPTASDIAAGEFGNRPPTPRPHLAAQRKQPGLSKRSTSLAFDAMLSRSDNYVSPYSMEAAGSTFTSPERPNGSVGSTPVDIPSSPPIPQQRSPSPSSPALPMFPGHHDSGFVSGPLDEDLADDDDELRPVDEEDIEVASHYKMRTNVMPSELSIMEEVPGDPSLLPRKSLQRPRPPPRPKAARKPRNTAPAPSSPKLPPLTAPPTNGTRRKSSVQFDKAQLSDADQAVSTSAGANDELIKRSDSVVSDNVTPSDAGGQDGLDPKPTGGRQTTGSSLKRKKAIQDRLASSIAAGEMPVFCKNCGEINTPTWRKAFVKVETGSPDALQLSDSEDGILAWEAVSKDDDGKVTSYRIIKKSVGADDTGFEEVQLCNPCGIWLLKNKTMRPADKWAKSQAPEAPRPRRNPTKKKDAPSEAAEAQPESDQQQPATAERYTVSESHDSNSKIPPQPRGTQDIRRANSMCAPNRSHMGPRLLEDGAAAAALKKAIQSSPPRFPGSKHSPIELDDEGSPEPARRLLFPSPRSAGEAKLLNGPSIENNDTLETLGKDSQGCDMSAQEDKENQPPTSDEADDEIDDLFELSESAGTPRTPRSASKVGDLFKTPSGKGSGRQALTPRNFLTDESGAPSSHRTPSRITPGYEMEQMTPFTAQLTQLMSEANYPPVEDGAGGHMFGDQLRDEHGLFDFADFEGHDLNGVPGPTSSSSPLFSLYEDPMAVGAGTWDESGFLAGSIDAFLEQNS